MEPGAAGAGFDPREAQARASGSSFYAGMRLLPKAERDAMFAIYAFSRAVDDIADEGNASRGARHNALEEWRRDIDALYDGSPPPRAAFLVPAVRRYGLRREDFLAVIDGMDMDVAEDIRVPDLATLDLYCERVASAVGRLSTKVFGMEDGPGFKLAHHLGRALQLTNILRDLDEDAAVGRLYLPREFLSEAGIGTRDPATAIADPAVDKACRRVATLAHEHYAAAETILRARPAGLLRAPNLMRAVYSEILAKMEQVGWVPPRHRVRIGRGRLLLTVLRHGLT
ncbi:MAG TPA: presqualene diphosphate synthase HpnD [Micropepsaceae bacterium]|nr:presqualene diphosphate synthase HpnD [Micropepsaceae bacterium]